MKFLRVKKHNICNNNNIIFYSANIQLDKNLFSALCRNIEIHCHTPNAYNS